MSSLYIGSSGLQAFNTQLTMASNNIANSETTAFKSSTTTFSDILNKSITRPWGETSGNGVRVQTVTETWTQGTPTERGVATDMAINGSGFFVVRNSSNEELYYTRDGSFSFDDDGNYVTSAGDAVQGYVINEDGNLGALTDISVSHENAAPRATTEMDTTINLNSDDESGDTFSATINVYDSLGNEIPLTITCTKSASANEWTYTASIPSEYGSISSGASGTLTFDSDGILENGTDPVFELDLTNGAADQEITWNIYEDDGSTNGDITQYSIDSNISDQDQDGYTAGEVTKIYIDDEGVLTATYSNGEQKALFQVALADFNNYDGLKKTDNNYYLATPSSGDAIYGVSGTGRLGDIIAGSLEGSNVDLATEMTTVITAQSAYQACAKIITTSDEMLQTLVKM